MGQALQNFVKIVNKLCKKMKINIKALFLQSLDIKIKDLGLLL